MPSRHLLPHIAIRVTCCAIRGCERLPRQLSYPKQLSVNAILLAFLAASGTPCAWRHCALPCRGRAGRHCRTDARRFRARLCACRSAEATHSACDSGAVVTDTDHRARFCDPCRSGRGCARGCGRTMVDCGYYSPTTSSGSTAWRKRYVFSCGAEGNCRDHSPAALLSSAEFCG